MPARNIGAPILIIGIGGAVLAYSGVRGKSVSGSVRALLAGNSPANADQSLAIQGAPPVIDSSGFNLTSSSSTGGVSQQAFYSDVLRSIGAPVTQGALDALAGVTQTEGVNNYYNPFNIEWHPGDNTLWQGVANFNDVGVQKYGSYSQGVNATAAYLTNNSHWSPVVSALKTGNQTLIEATLQAAYTWAAFKRAGANASSILSAPVGG